MVLLKLCNCYPFGAIDINTKTWKDVQNKFQFEIQFIINHKMIIFKLINVMYVISHIIFQSSLVKTTLSPMT